MNKIAILIDGGFFLRCLPAVYYPNHQGADPRDPESADIAIRQLVASHLGAENSIVQAQNPRSLLYRVFYYDARPYLEKVHLPVSKKLFDFGGTQQAKFRLGLFDRLRGMPDTAVRLGNVRWERRWALKKRSQRRLLNQEIRVENLTDRDFTPDFRQKAVDMRIGTNIASLTLKRLVGTIVLVTGDSDFVPVSKLARREGIKVILDPLWRNVSAELFEHVDGVRSGFPKPGGA